ncbi:MAG: DUF2027 domain-containing protein [Bacteroidia bacterium]|nr:DUF2027 domain-containing protein [Bacteroidia bacterium]
MKKGDKVRFLNAVGGGTITHIEGSTVYVEDEDGFEIPTPANEVVVINETPSAPTNQAARTYFSEAKAEPVKEVVTTIRETESGIQSKDTPHIVLSFLKADRGNSGDLELYVVNDSPLYAYFSIGQISEDGKKAEPIYRKELIAHEKAYIGKYNPQRIDNRLWQCQAILFHPTATYKPYDPINRDIRIKSTRFFKNNSFVENDYFDEKAVSYDVTSDELEAQIERLTEHDMHSILSEKEQKNQPKVSKRSINDLLEVDLHIEQIIDSTAGMSNGEIIQVQLARFEHVMQENADRHGQRIVFIHGVGNGRLKTEVTKLLDRKYKKAQYQDASFKEYGYGATLVIIK